MEIIRQFQGTVESVESAARRVGKEEARADAPRPRKSDRISQYNRHLDVAG